MAFEFLELEALKFPVLGTFIVTPYECRTAVIAPLPVGLEGSKERLERADQMLMEAKKSTVPIATFICLPLLGALPLFVVKLLARNLITTALMSIVPGPAFTGKLMGHEAHRIMFGGGLLVGNIGKYSIIIFDLALELPQLSKK